MTKIDAFAHILPPAYAERLESIVSAGAVSERILGYRPWIREEPAPIDLDARWRSIDPFGDYRQILTLAGELNRAMSTRHREPARRREEAAINPRLNARRAESARSFRQPAGDQPPSLR